jgi:hypothetical protein
MSQHFVSEQQIAQAAWRAEMVAEWPSQKSQVDRDSMAVAQGLKLWEAVASHSSCGGAGRGWVSHSP